MGEQVNEQYVTLIDLLDSWGIDLRNGSSAPVRVVRHAGDNGIVRRFYDLGYEAFECYQRSQKRRVFGDARILISFIQAEGHEGSFVGVYRVNGVERCPSDLHLPSHIPSDLTDKCRSEWQYRLDRDTEFDCFRERVRILWDKVEVRWVRQYPDANRKIVAIKDNDGKWTTPKSREALLNVGIVSSTEEPLEYDVSSYPEGTRSLRSHLTIERNSALTRDSKARFKALNGRLFCQACGFDFVAIYGEEYIECHHTIPVHKLPSDGSTRIEDVALLCSNCHRIIHRRKEWMSVDSLRKLLDGRKKG
jgi:5-methylcytosine-specific restriction endonuclease McrA